MFIHFGNIFGVRLWRWKRSQAELWFCPAGTIIPEHVHNEMESKIMFVAGRMLFTRGSRQMVLSWKTPLRLFKVKAGEPHSATILGKFGIFLNVESWRISPTSASQDFHKT